MARNFKLIQEWRTNGGFVLLNIQILIFYYFPIYDDTSVYYIGLSLKKTKFHQIIQAYKD